MRGCVNQRHGSPKAGYRTLQSALARAEQLNRINRERTPFHPVVAYPCPAGTHGWHVGGAAHWHRDWQNRTLYEELGPRAWSHLLQENGRRSRRIPAIRERWRTAVVRRYTTGRVEARCG